MAQDDQELPPHLTPGNPAFDEDAFYAAVAHKRDTTRGGEGFLGIQRTSESLVRGAAGAVSMIPEAAGIVTDRVGEALQEAAAGNSMLEFLDPVGQFTEARGEQARRAAQAVRDFSDEHLRSLPGRGGFFSETVAEGVGSSVPFLTSGGVAGLAGVGAKGIMAITATQGALTNGASEYLAAEQGGASERERWQSFLLGSAVGTTEAFPLSAMAGRLAGLDKRSGGKLRQLVDVLIEGGEEAAQEMFQQASSNAIAVHIRDEDRDAFEGLLESGAAGGVSGLLLSMLIPGRERGQLPPQGAQDVAAPSPGPEQVVPAEGRDEDALPAAAEGQVAIPEVDEVAHGVEDDAPPASGAMPDSPAEAAPQVEDTPTPVSGKPLRLYHGTDSPGFSEFDDAFVGSATDEGFLGEGHYFSTDPEVARGKRATVPVDVQPQNPLHLDLPKWGADKKELVRQALGLPEDATAAEVTAEAQRQGYDSVRLDYSPVGYEHSEYVVFDAGAIQMALSPRERLDTQEIPDEALEGAAQPIDKDEPERRNLYAGLMPLFGTPTAKEMGRRVKAFAARNLRSRGNLPENVFARKIERDSAVQSELEEVRLGVADFDREFRSAYGVRPAPNAAKQIDQAFKGDADALAQLPDELQRTVKQLRAHVDRLSQRMIDEGVIEGDLALKVSKNMGTYATRTYKVFEDPKWAEKVPVEVRNRAKSFIRREQGISEAEAETLIETMLHAGKAADNPIKFLAEGKMGSKDLSILKKRKTIPSEIRALYGENENARTNYANSVIKMAALIENHRLLRDIKEMGMGRFLFKADNLKRGPEFRAQIAAETSKTLEPLNGLMTTPEIKQAFEDMVDTGGQVAAWLRMWLRFNSTAKAAKTIQAPATQARNTVSVPLFMLANGVMGPRGMARAFKATFASLGTKRGIPLRNEYLRLARLGVVSESTRAGELRDLARDAGIKGPEEFLRDHTRDTIKKALIDAPARAYQIPDDFGHAVVFYSTRAKYEKAMPDATPEELDAIAAEHARNGYPTYSMVPRLGKELRRFPFTASFVSFPAEVLRTGNWLLKTTARELKSENPKIRAIARQRAMGMLAASAIPSAAAAFALRYIVGMDWEEEKNARKFLAPWDQDAQLMWLGMNSRGERTYVNFSYTDPYSYIKDPLRSLLLGEDWQDSLQRSVGSLLDPFLSEEIGTAAIVDLMRNKTSTGGKVYNESEPGEKQLADMVAHLWDAVEPGWLSSAQRVRKGLNKEVEVYGKAWDEKDELMAMTTGIRRSALNVPTALRFRADDFSRANANATRTMGDVMYSASAEVSEDDIRKAYEEAEAIRRDHFGEMVDLVHAARALGQTKDQVQAALEQTLPKQAVQDILEGRYRPYVPSSSYMASAIKKAPEAQREELRRRRTILRQIARDAR